MDAYVIRSQSFPNSAGKAREVAIECRNLIFFPDIDPDIEHITWLSNPTVKSMTKNTTAHIFGNGSWDSASGYTR